MQRRKLMSNNYEKAWENLKRRLMCVALYSRHFAESKKYNADDCLRARGGEAMARAILEFMEDVESSKATSQSTILISRFIKEMTTAGQGDGQSAQD